jgi:flagellar L-ring protein precursor FlgH
LWRDGKSGVLFLDDKASRAGDIVTVLVMESSSSGITADTNTKKDTSASFNLSNFFGNTHLFAKEGKNRAQLEYAGKSEQKNGGGSITREGTVTAQIPARVVKVLENGLLVVEGRRAVVVNDETQTLAFSGLVRPEDITPENTVRSTQVADAEVTLVGKGVLADKQRPGILQMFIDMFRLF